MWPLHCSPARRNASLLTGAVAIAWTRPCLRVCDGADDHLVRGSARGRAQHPGRERGTRRRAIDERFADIEHTRVGRGARRHFGPDAGGIAGRDRDSRFHCGLRIADCGISARTNRSPPTRSRRPIRTRQTRSRTDCHTRLRCRSRRAAPLSRSAARSAGSTSAARTIRTASTG